MVGAAFFAQTLAVNGETVRFEIWDTSGQERYHSLAPMYYWGAAAAIIVYDITNPVSEDRCTAEIVICIDLHVLLEHLYRGISETIFSIYNYLLFSN